MNGSTPAITFRAATAADLPAVLALLVEDVLGKDRERLDAQAVARYEAAFQQIEGQSGNQILLGVRDSEIVAMLQLTFIPGLSHQGALRAQIESVRVKGSERGKGVGKLLFRHAIALSRDAGCAIVQLTTDRRRPDAARFYEALGFEPTHVGMKLALSRAG